MVDNAAMISIETFDGGIPVLLGGVVFAVLHHYRGRKTYYLEWSLAYFALAGATFFGSSLASQAGPAQTIHWSAAPLLSLFCLGLFFHFHTSGSLRFMQRRNATAIAATIAASATLAIIIFSSLSNTIGLLASSFVVMIMFIWEGYILKDGSNVGTINFYVNIARGVLILLRPLAIASPSYHFTHSGLVIFASTSALVTLLAMAIARENAEVRRALADLEIANGLLQRQAQALEEIAVELSDQRSRAAAADEAKLAFLTNINHEFRTPLNAVLGFSEVLKWNPSLDAKAREAIENMHRAGKTLFHFVERAIDLSRIIGEEPPLQRVVNLGLCIDEAIDRVRDHLSDRSVAIRQPEPRPKTLVQGDPFIITRAICQLLDNAVTYSPNGSTVDVAWSGDPEEGVTLQIMDRGRGLDANISAEAPGMFVRGESVAGLTTPGLGIGLFMTRKLLSLVGASLALTPNTGGGTIARIRFAPAAASKDRLLPVGDAGGA